MGATACRRVFWRRRSPGPRVRCGRLWTRDRVSDGKPRAGPISRRAGRRRWGSRSTRVHLPRARRTSERARCSPAVPSTSARCGWYRAPAAGQPSAAAWFESTVVPPSSAACQSAATAGPRPSRPSCEPPAAGDRPGSAAPARHTTTSECRHGRFRAWASTSVIL